MGLEQKETSAALPQVLAEEFLQHFRLGQVCLHPTDTICGLTADPANKAALQRLAACKGRAESKSFVHLVDSLATALAFWEPLPGNWETLLASIWPNPLTVIWKQRANSGLHTPDTTLALRWGQLPSWYQLVLAALKRPIPTTSVNHADAPAITDWAEAVAWLEKHHGYAPRGWCNMGPRKNTPSTLIRLDEDGTFQVLRQGAFDLTPWKPLSK